MISAGCVVICWKGTDVSRHCPSVRPLSPYPADLLQPRVYMRGSTPPFIPDLSRERSLVMYTGIFTVRHSLAREEAVYGQHGGPSVHPSSFVCVLSANKSSNWVPERLPKNCRESVIFMKIGAVTATFHLRTALNSTCNAEIS